MTTFAVDDPALNESARNAAWAALILRLALGVMFIAHALLKLFVFTLPGTAQFFGSLGLPPAIGYVTFAAELVGGILLVLGIRTRYVAAALIPILLGATWAHAGILGLELTPIRKSVSAALLDGASGPNIRDLLLDWADRQGLVI